MAFASNSALHALANADTYHMDGTFATAPRLFYQIVTLHAFVLGVMLPLVFCLLPNKDGNTYINFLSLVKEKSESMGFTISPQHIMQDFKKGLMNACLHVFPRVIVKGCYFHYAQCLWQRIQGIGLPVSYRENADHRNWFHMLLAMPLVPVPHVKGAFQFVKNIAPDVPRVRDFNYYFDRTWMNGYLYLCMTNKRGFLRFPSNQKSPTFLEYAPDI